MFNLRRVLFSFAFILGFAISAQAEFTRAYVTNVPLDSTSVTETGVALSSTSFNTIILAANSNRLDFDIYLTTCTAPGTTSTKVHYGYDAFISSGANVNTSAWLDSSGKSAENWFVKPEHVNYQGPVRAWAEEAGCYVTVREWVTTSPLFQ